MGPPSSKNKVSQETSEVSKPETSPGKIKPNLDHPEPVKLSSLSELKSLVQSKSDPVIDKKVSGEKVQGEQSAAKSVSCPQTSTPVKKAKVSDLSDGNKSAAKTMASTESEK